MIQEQTKNVRDRRNQGRFRQAVKAICQVNGRSYMARTYDINQKGMTLLAVPTIPRAHKYLVQCRLPTGTSAIFEVEEKQRRVLGHRDNQFLRLGLNLVTESMENLAFFQELALLYQQNPETTRLNPCDPITETLEGMDRDGTTAVHHRVPFQLPAFVQLGKQSIKCETLDLSPVGISLRVPEGFPRQNLFALTFLDPNGEELSLTVREKNRRGLRGRGLRLGCEVMSGGEAMQHFLAASCR